MKICTKCGQSKSLDEFYIDRSKPNGKSYRCRQCVKMYYTKNRKAILEYHKNRYDLNREAILAYAKQYRNAKKII